MIVFIQFLHLSHNFGTFRKKSKEILVIDGHFLSFIKQIFAVFAALIIAKQSYGVCGLCVASKFCC